MNKMRQRKLKLSNPIFTIVYVVGILTFLFSCNENAFEEYERYEPKVISADDDVVTYESITSYPYLDTISTVEPVIDIESYYSLVLDTIKAPENSTYVKTKFDVDSKTGVVTYRNAGELSAGDYVLSMGVTTASGVVVLEDVLTMSILAVPIEVAIDQSTVDVGALELGPIATVSYTDKSEGEISEVSYSLVGSPVGLAIDAASGVISKTGTITENSVVLSVLVTTNLGLVQVENILTVNVGEAPSLSYSKQDGSTPLSKVTLSPWTAYTTSQPSLEGMNADGGYEVILPEPLVGFESAFTFGANGQIGVMADAGLPEGEYELGVRVTNGGGVSADFESLFSISVEAVWSEVINEQLNEPDHGMVPQNVYADWKGYNNDGTSSGTWTKVNGVSPVNYSGIRSFNPGDTDVSLLKTLDVTGVKGLRITFGDVAGTGDIFLTRYDRMFYFGDDNSDVEGGAFTPANWTTLIDADGWATENNWKLPAIDYSFNINMADVDGNTLYLHWRLIPDPTDPDFTQKGQWIIDYFTAESATAYTAIEE